MDEIAPRHSGGVKLQLMDTHSCLQKASALTEYDTALVRHADGTVSHIGCLVRYQPSETDSCGLVCPSVSEDPGCDDSISRSQ